MCSIHQLPQKKNRIANLIKNMSNVEFHFALENISGKGKKFLLNCIKEARIFKKAKIIDSTKTSWSELNKIRLKKNK